MNVRHHASGIDVLRIVAAHAIVAHHLAIYTTMADAAWPLAPELFRALADHARKAVQVFLVMGGFLAARSLMPIDAGGSQGADDTARRTGGAMSALALLGSRFLRLAPMVWVALLAVTVVQAWVGPASSGTVAATAMQIAANALLLQDVLGVPSMSAGLWYVAIDLQLFACAAVLTRLGPRSRHGVLACVVVAVVASAWVFNRDARGDAFAPYFMASYGLGMLAAWAGATRRAADSAARAARVALVAAGVGVVVALTVDFRDRLVLALVTTWGLWALHREPPPAPVREPGSTTMQRALRTQAGATYALFLLHYPLLLLVDAWWTRSMPSTPLGQGAGLLVTWVGAWGLAMAVHRWVEPRIIRT